MGRRSNWNAVRMVAENLRLGDRVYWNLVKIPDLPTSGFEAIGELEREGLVEASLRDNRVEPTPAFWPWLEELRLAEEQQAMARQREMLPPGQRPAPTPEPNKPSVAASPPSEEPSS